uniref:Uncharacterized protein n=1 Tax=Aegilops tauschii subsp. strangulata TaxID=200361 RepID=A0A453I731_AEGTS
RGKIYLQFCRPDGSNCCVMQAFEPVVHCVPQQEPKNQLRRRNSASF